jgi:hypothetical protein
MLSAIHFTVPALEIACSGARLVAVRPGFGRGTQHRVETTLVACDFLIRAGFQALPLFPALDPSAYDLSTGELTILPGVITAFGAGNLGGIVRSEGYVYKNNQQEEVQ